MDTINPLFSNLEDVRKHISVFCIVKDDADIIESYCRYHLSFLDSIVIWDDNSSDSTQEIVKQLANEGLSVELIVIPKDEPFLRNFNLSVLQRYASYVFEKHNADLVIPLDADEFLYCEDGSNPRDALEKLDEKAEHRFFWRTSVYTKDPDDNSVFLPNYFEEYRDPAFEIFPKTLLSKYIVEKCGGWLMAGKHGLAFPDEAMRNSVPIINNDLIRIAHFPIRSTYHAMIKTVCMQLRSSTFIGASPFQYKRIYDEIKSYGKPTKEQTRSYSLEYAIYQEQLVLPINTIKQFRGALKADFLNNSIRLAYTNYQSNNHLEQILSFFELLLEKLKMEINMNKDDADETKKLLAQTVHVENDLRDAELRIHELEKTVLKANDELQQASTRAEHLLNSTSWRMTKPLRVVMNFLRRKR